MKELIMIGKIESKRVKPISKAAKNGVKTKSIQDVWDDELMDENSPQHKLMLEMAEEALAEFKAGNR
ncbi:MAG TPA: hypothetical protein PLE30_08360 [Candidatus Kapabacteria bacterium]|nr:hypothetical protein [Candidatus Kapabacteria bacterium]